MAVEKAKLREILRGCRTGLSATWISDHSRTIQNRLIASDAFVRAATVVLYAAKDNEVATNLLFAEALTSCRRVLFPKVSLDKRELSLVRVDDLAELVPGAFGVLEPMGAETVPVNEIEQALICVPGLAFSLGGHRLGRGGGYYDRLLAMAGSRSLSVGLAYSFQVLDRLPQSPTDRRLNLIVSEYALYEVIADELPRAQTDHGGNSRC